MKTIKLLTLLVLFSLQAGATGYSHNMFVAHKKLQAGKECHTVNTPHVTTKKKTAPRVIVKAAVARPEASLRQQISKKLSGIVTLNQRIVEQGPSYFFTVEEETANNSIVNKLVGFVKSLVLTFLGSTTIGKA